MKSIHRPRSKQCHTGKHSSRSRKPHPETLLISALLIESLIQLIHRLVTVMKIHRHSLHKRSLLPHRQINVRHLRQRWHIILQHTLDRFVRSLAGQCIICRGTKCVHIGPRTLLPSRPILLLRRKATLKHNRHTARHIDIFFSCGTKVDQHKLLITGQ